MMTKTILSCACLAMTIGTASAQEYCRDREGLYHYAGDIACRDTSQTATTRLASSASGNPACASGERQAAADAKASLLARYPASPALVLSLHESYMRDYSELCTVARTEENGALLDRLAAQYYPQFSLIWSLYQSNMQAAERLRAR